MIIHQISQLPSPALSKALADFELPFTYPLGAGASFRISHGRDYSLFFRAQGEACCFIAEQEGKVVGSLAAVIRELQMPGGNECPAAYFGDLKIVPSARNGLVLLQLARAAEKWVRPRVRAAFGVVMGGTVQAPNAYTGRAGIPGFQEVGRLAILRISRAPGDSKLDVRRFLSAPEEGMKCFQDLSREHYACPLGEPRLRSEIPPTWLVHPDGSACGLLEDTRKAKRLITNDGRELPSAHFSCFAHRSVSTAVELLGVALQETARLGLPALFLSVAESESKSLRDGLLGAEVLTAPATVYGAGLQPGTWNINSSEI